MEQKYNSHLSNYVAPLSQKLWWSSGFFVLPSLRLFKSVRIKSTKKAGIYEEILHWMKNELGQHRSIPTEGYEGGLILDEMSVQADLQFTPRENKTYLIGFNDKGSESTLVEDNQKFN